MLSRSRQDKIHTQPSSSLKSQAFSLCAWQGGPTDTWSHTGMSGESRTWVLPSGWCFSKGNLCRVLPQPGALLLGFGSERRSSSQRGKQGWAGGTKAAQQRHLVLHSDGCMRLPGELSAAPAPVPCPAVQTPCPPGADRWRRALSTGQGVKAGFWQQQAQRVSEKATKEISVYCTLFFPYSFTVALLQSTGISPECSVETCASPICRYQVHQQHFVFFLQEVP